MNLDISGDKPTQQALHRAFDVLLNTRVEDLKGRRLEASDFDALLSADPMRDLLSWLNDPEGTVGEWQGARWDAFRSRCKADWKLNPEADGVLVAAEPVAEQIRSLLDAGWGQARMVTDHGWLLVPGGMPKTELAKYLAATRWGRVRSGR